jgi:hypothetical protein
MLERCRGRAADAQCFFRAWGSPAVLWVLSEFFSTKADADFPHTYRTHYRTILGGDFFDEFNSHGGTRTTVTWSSDTRGYPRSPKVHGKSITEEISSGGKDSKRSKDSFKIAYTQRFVHQCISWQLFSCFTFRKNHQTSYFTWNIPFNSSVSPMCFGSKSRNCVFFLSPGSPLKMGCAMDQTGYSTRQLASGLYHILLQNWFCNGFQHTPMWTQAS